MNAQAAIQLSKKDFESGQDVRWCPGCGDYAILSAVQKALPELGIAKEKVVFVSGIGCSSRFPYYMNTYGFHSIHGRAPAIATGIKVSNPDLSVWLVTGDGDGLSIGGNHLIHLARRNVDVNILLFNNEIYGLTKGQYSPTSREGTLTKSSPMGSQDHPVNPLAFMLGSGITWYGRTIDRDLKHMGEMIKAAPQHQGTSFIEFLQNCIVFNDNIYENLYNPDTKFEHSLFLEHGKPMLFGKERQYGLVVEQGKLKKVLANSVNAQALVVHDETNINQAWMLSQLETPVALGIIYRETRHVYEQDLLAREQETIAKKGPGELAALLKKTITWEVKA